MQELSRLLRMSCFLTEVLVFMGRMRLLALNRERKLERRSSLTETGNFGGDMIRLMVSTVDVCVDSVVVIVVAVRFFWILDIRSASKEGRKLLTIERMYLSSSACWLAY